MDFVDLAISLVGRPSMKYVSPDKGNNLDAFDCSGLVQYVLNETGVHLPFVPGKETRVRHSEEFFDHFGIFVHERAKKRGDLVFFSRNGVRPTHIGIYLGNDCMVHSPGTERNKVNVVNLSEYLGKKRIIYRPSRGEQIYFYNPIGYKRPAILSHGNRWHTSL